MKFFCLSLFKQGWLGVPIFFIGIASLGFSQLAQEASNAVISSQEVSNSIEISIKDLEKKLNKLSEQTSQKNHSSKEKTITRNLKQIEDSNEQDRISSNLDAVSETYDLRIKGVTEGISTVEGRLSEAKAIYVDLENNFAGRMDEALPSLQVLQDNIARSANEVKALQQLAANAMNDATAGLNSLIQETESFRRPTTPPSSIVKLPPSPVTDTGKSVVAAIKSSKAVPLSTENLSSTNIQSEAGRVRSLNDPLPNAEDDMIRKLKKDLESSKSLQTELSADTANLQTDLRRAYREIVNLQTSLKESEMMVTELETAKQSLWKTSDGKLPNADTVTKQINQLQNDLEITRNDLRQSRQSLLLEQERSNSMIRSITSELERTRRELDDARVAAVSSGADSGRLLLLERELNQTKRALQMARNAPQNPSAGTYLNLQDELRKAMAEIARMQVDIGQKDDLERQLLQLRSSMENMGDNPSRSASPAYVNKLLVDLNAAKKEVAKAQAYNQQERRDLAEKVITLESRLETTVLELEDTKTELAKTKESIASREFEFASTIKRLEEDAQLAQEALGKASLGQLPVMPFVNEMEENLANSEARMQSLAERFENEQSRATEVIDGLNTELDAALIRQKQAINELNVRERSLVGKDKEIAQLREEKRILKEELDVVKVIASQLDDLNDVLEKTKETQSSQTGSMDMVVASLRDELNKAKVELVFALEGKDRVSQESSIKIINLEQQLEDARAQLMQGEESLVEQSRDSKELMIELKSELDAAREEIARMKTAGLGESVETRQAVSQLQEALGTIRILQESLSDAENINSEVDNLRTELADAMSTQLDDLRRAENDKQQLSSKISDLEAEISILRESQTSSAVNQKNVIADLNQKLKVSTSLISNLEQRLEDAESSGILSISDLESELSSEREKSRELSGKIANFGKTKAKTVELLEQELMSALERLDTLENPDSNKALEALRLENERLLSALNNRPSPLIKQSEFPNSGVTDPTRDQVARLEERLEAAVQELSQLQNVSNDRAPDSFASKNKDEALVALEDELAAAEETIIALQNNLDGQKEQTQELFDQLNLATDRLNDMEKFLGADVELTNDLPTVDLSGNDLETELAVSRSLVEKLRNQNEREKLQRNNLEKKLLLALEKVDNATISQIPADSEDNQIILELKDLLKNKDKSILNLESKLEESLLQLTDLEAELELTKAMGDSVGNAQEKDVVVSLQNEINELKESLSVLKQSAPSNLPDIDLLQDQLQDAVAESMNTQMELEETKQKLLSLENDIQPNKTDQELNDFIEKAKLAESVAMERVEELTAALRDSERLRKEVEGVLLETVESQPKVNPLSEDPRVLELQNELVLLQQDLLNARNLTDPKVFELEKALASSRDDSVRINEEFKNAMQDFGRMKEQLDLLEDENRKLNNISLVQAKNEASLANEQIKTQLNRALVEIADYKQQLTEKDKRLSSLTNQLADSQTRVPGISPDNSALRAQTIRAQGLAQLARDGEQQAKLKIQRLNEELARSDNKIVSLEEQIRLLQSNQRGVPSRLSSPSGFSGQSPSISPLQMSELASLREQNQKLKEQFRELANAPGRNDMDIRIQELNQKNLTAQIQLDQERSRVQDLLAQLSDARNIKREIIERGQSANLKVNLLNDELDDSRGKVASLEKALISAREAIRVLQRGGTGNSTLNVSMPKSVSSSSSPARFARTPPINRSNNFTRPVAQTFSPTSGYSRFPRIPNTEKSPTSVSLPSVQNFPDGEASIQLKAEVQFLNNKKKPAGFTEFFLVRDGLDSIMNKARIRVPANEDINSPAEYWARAVQRGYRFPGVAASIRNALASSSLTRIKTNSMGVANVANLTSGNYFIVGTSSLGQVGVVWSKQVSLSQGENQVSLDLRDAIWAQ